MKILFQNLVLPTLQNIQKRKMVFIGVTGFLSGVGLLKYTEFLTEANLFGSNYTILLWWAIVLSVSAWMLLRLSLRQSYVAILTAIFYFSIVCYWLSNEVSPIAFSAIFFRSENFAGPFVFTGLLLASMNVVEYFLLSQNAVKLIAFAFFSILFTGQIIPALINIRSTKIEVFLVCLMLVSVLSAMWIVTSELLFFVFSELFQKAGIYAEKK